MMPEQIIGAWSRPSDAALVDRWGRVFRLDPQTAVGRGLGRPGIVLVQVSVSREHAEIVVGPAGTWTVSDRGSTNATRVNDVVIEETTPLTSGDLVAFGDIGFYFVQNAESLVDGDHDDVDEPTPPAFDVRRLDPESEVPLPPLPLRFLESRGTGGGYVEVRGRRLRLTENQFAMLLALARRMVDEQQLPSVIRGFVPSAHLVAELPWGTAVPTESHLKQLVRRTRRVLALVGADLIESRRGFGYRLRATPQLDVQTGDG